MSEQVEQPAAGPASLGGVVVGLMLAGIPVMTDSWTPQSGWLVFCAVPPACGLALLLVPGVVRRFGFGLVVSALAIPAFIFSWPVAAVVFN